MPDEYPLHAAIRVRTYELDSFGHVNNAEYLHYLEAARAEFLRQMGLSFSDFGKQGVQFVIVEAHVRYLSPARYGDDITIRGRFRDVRPASAWIDYVLTNTATERTIAIADTKGAFLDAMVGKPCRAPENFRAAFAAHARETG